MRRFLGAAVLAGLMLIPAGARQAVDVDTFGPKAGERALDFSLSDQHGRTQTLASLAGPKGTMLVFFRSADW